MDVPHYWTVDQVGRLLGALAVDNRLQARALALIMWRTGLLDQQYEHREACQVSKPRRVAAKRSSLFCP